MASFSGPRLLHSQKENFVFSRSEGEEQGKDSGREGREGREEKEGKGGKNGKRNEAGGHRHLVV